jgi:hypothetical protein
MDETAQTHLVAELALNESLVKLAVNMAVQLVIDDHGKMERVRQLVVNLEATGALGPAIPKITPSVAAGHDTVGALRLAGAKGNHTAQFIAEQAALAAQRMGIKISR